MYSSRTSWNRQPNRLTQVLEKRRKAGERILDLTNSNPTECGIVYPEQEILPAFSDHELLRYRPDSRGLLSAREAVCGYYVGKNILVDPSNIFLTASTSEAYSLIFKLLCDSGDNVLVPEPSYPLFDFLANVNDVQLSHYALRFDHEWHVDLESVRDNITGETKAIVLVHPHNPTGMFLKQEEYREIVALARENNLALIVDEVFIDYAFSDDSHRVVSTAGEPEVRTFTMNGISKSCGFPQMKLGWIVVSGNRDEMTEASERLEILCDTFLSVNTPAQIALPALLNAGKTVRASIRNRIQSNLNFLQTKLQSTQYSVVPSEGGWYALLKTPKTVSDEQWTISLLEKGVYVQPGYFFDLDEGFLVVSLLVEERIFQDGITLLGDMVK